MQLSQQPHVVGTVSILIFPEVPETIWGLRKIMALPGLSPLPMHKLEEFGSVKNPPCLCLKVGMITSTPQDWHSVICSLNKYWTSKAKNCVMHLIYTGKQNTHRLWLLGASCPGLNKIIHIEFLAQSLANKTCSIIINIIMTTSFVT